jgi:hypothetical protein
VSESMVVRVRVAAAAVAVFAVALLVLGTAGAAANTVVNGGFESGDFEGWSVVNEPSDSGDWFVYGAEEGPFPPPPQGEFAAITQQSNPGTHILYQDVPIEAGQTYLSMIVYYDSSGPIAVPNPDTLEAGDEGDGNQQYRVEVMDPAAPLESVASSDILATVFRTLDGDPAFIGPHTVGVDLSAFVGQTVRLRLAEVDDLGEFNAGVDAVMTGPAPIGPPLTPVAPPAPPAPPAPSAPLTPPSSAFTFGKLKLNKKNGTATLKVNLPGAGTLTAVDAKKKGPKRIKKATAITAAAGTLTLTLKATGAGKKTLREKGKLQFRALVTFAPTGGTAATQAFAGKLKLSLP